MARIYPFYEAQYFLYTVLGVVLLLGYLISVLRINRLVKLLFLVGLTGVGLSHLNLNPHNGVDWLGTMEIIRAAEQKEVAVRQVVFEPWYEAITFVYYYDRANFEKGYLLPLFENLRAKHVDFFDLKVYESSYEQKFKEKQVEQLILVQCRYAWFDPDSLFPKKLAQEYEWVQTEEILHNRVSIFEKKPIERKPALPAGRKWNE